MGQGEALTRFPSFHYLPMLVSKRRIPMQWAVPNEADVPAPQPQAGQQARVSCSDEDEGRSRNAEPAAAAGTCHSRGDGGRQVVPTKPEAGEAFPREVRVRHTKEIRALLERGKRKRTKNVEVFLAPSPASFCRFGLIVPKHGRRIVDRNRLKRRLREIGRRRVLPLLADRGAAVDVLVRVRREAYRATFDELLRDVGEAVEVLWSEES